MADRPSAYDEMSLAASSHHHRNKHHHDDHHHSHTKEVIVDRDKESAGWGAIIFIGICCFLFFLLLVLSSVALSQSTDTQHTMSAQMLQWQETFEAQMSQHYTPDAKMIAMGTLATASSKSPSSSFSLAKHYRVPSLCALQSYYTRKGDAVLKNDDKLERLTQTIEEIRQKDMKDFYYYHVQAHLRLSVGLMDKNHRRYLTIGHNITSSFGRLSSIRLEELEFNTVDQSLGAIRNIVLCTNNPFLDVQRCDASLTKRNILTLRGQENVPLVMSTTTPPKTSSSEPSATTVHQEQAVDLKSGEEEGDDNVADQRHEVIGLRMYNLVFYQALEDEQRSRDKDSRDVSTLKNNNNKSRTHGSGSLDNANSYKEQRILTLDLTQC